MLLSGGFNQLLLAGVVQSSFRFHLCMHAVLTAMEQKTLLFLRHFLLMRFFIFMLESSRCKHKIVFI